MNCADMESALLDYHFAVGSQEWRDTVWAHLRACAACARMYLDLKHDIDSGEGMQKRPRAAIREKLRAEVETLFRPGLFAELRRYLAQPTPRYRALLAMAASAVLVLTAGALLPDRGPKKPGREWAQEHRLTPALQPNFAALRTLPRGGVDTARLEAVSLTFY